MKLSKTMLKNLEKHLDAAAHDYHDKIRHDNTQEERERLVALFDARDLMFDLSHGVYSVA